MYWLFGVIIGAVVLLLLVLIFANFRRYTWLIILVVALLLATLSILYLRDSDDASARDYFSLENIVLGKAELSPSHGSYYRFSVSVENLAINQQLAAMEVLIELLDCIGSGPNRQCEVSESNEKRINLRLLATNAKRVESYIAFSNIAIERADDQWRYTLIRGIGR
ncbi:MAG: hypothetical protein JKY90_00315 [Gammaproteobacteria bacterium]|nr:hypothetical protein [Gammaproteobacteria bacterium]